MKEPTLTITVEEGTLIYIPGRRLGTNKHDRAEGFWRLLPKKGKGTRPIPHRFRRYLEKPNG